MDNSLSLDVLPHSWGSTGISILGELQDAGHKARLNAMERKPFRLMNTRGQIRTQTCQRSVSRSGGARSLVHLDPVIGSARRWRWVGEICPFLTFMMLDRDVAAVSPAATYRVLKSAGLVGSRPAKTSRKGRGFEQPLQPHEHWHVDFSHINLGGTFYYLCSVLDGASRAILAWDIRPQMREADAEIVIQRAREAYPQARPRIITDNGPQFVAQDFKEFIRLWQATRVFCSPYHPQSNGKLERFHRTLKEDAIRPKTPLTLEDAKRIVGDFIDHYNTVRLHSALGYVTPADGHAGRHIDIFAARDKKLQAARENRKIKCQQPTRLVA